MSETERLLAAIVDIQHHIKHGPDDNTCAACPRWDELQGAAVAIVKEFERLTELIVLLNDVIHWPDDDCPLELGDDDWLAVKAIAQEKWERDLRKAAAKGGTR